MERLFKPHFAVSQKACIACAVGIFSLAIVLALVHTWIASNLINQGAVNGHTSSLLLRSLAVSIFLGLIVTLALFRINQRHNQPLLALKHRQTLADKGEHQPAVASSEPEPKDFQEMQRALDSIMQRLEKTQTELKQAQQTLKEHKKTERTLLSTLNHEAPHFLSNLLDPLQLLAETALTEWQQQYLNLAIDSGNDLSNTFHELLELNNIGNIQIKPHRIDFNLRECIEDSLALIAEAAHQKQVSIHTSIPKGLPETVNTDPVWLRQILQILLKNTLKYATHKQTILFQTQYSKGDIHGSARINFTAQAKKTDSQEGQGVSRLGWVICQRIAQSLDGQLKLDEHNTSARASVSIPLSVATTQVKTSQKRPRRVTTTPEKMVDQPYRSASALIIDDNRANQLMTKALLAELGYRVDTASHQDQAIELFQTVQHELVLLDCNIYNQDCLETAQKIRAVNTNKAPTALLAMMAVARADDIHNCLQAGINGILIKPLTFETIKQRLATYSSHQTHSVKPPPHVITNGTLALSKDTTDGKMIETIETFLDQSSVQLTTLRQAVKTRDWTKTAEAAQMLAKQSEQLGATQLASVCSNIEAFAKNGSISQPYNQRLMAELDEAHHFVENYLRKRLLTVRESTLEFIGKKKETVLVVDDDPGVRLLIKRTLAPVGLHIEEATNGQEAIDKFKLFKPDLILMDALMPVMDGFESCRRINLLSEGDAPPILIVTSLESDESVERAFVSGATDFVAKPIHFAVLKQRVRRVLEARRTEQQVKHLAYCDSLTGLPNRIAFTNRLQQELAYAKRNHNQLAVMFIDVDHFKDVNDNLGHAAGDELLILLAKRVSTCLRGEDTLARLGGDEFVIAIGSACKPENANIVANKIISELSQPFRISGRDIYVGASIGVSIYPDDGKTHDALLKHADTAMYRAKALGRNNFQFYTTEMTANISRRISLETDLRTVLQSEQLQVYFQPKANAQSGTISGAEALIRWQHPKRGFLSPDTFITIAEDAGLMNEISHWVMLNSCTVFQAWHQNSHFTGSVAVNISARQLMDKNFITNVKQCLQLSQLPAQFLELEITEGIILDNPDEAIKRLTQLGDMGVKIAIDDFGTGFSSFNYLRRLPAKILKIDKSFVDDVPRDVSGAAIVDGMIKLAHNLSMEVVAEGVENSAQYQFLQAHNCDTIQGYWISRPIPAEQFHSQYVKHVTAV